MDLFVGPPCVPETQKRGTPSLWVPWAPSTLPLDLQFGPIEPLSCLISSWLEWAEGVCCICLSPIPGPGFLVSPYRRPWGHLLASTLVLAQGDPSPP